ERKLGENAARCVHAHGGDYTAKGEPGPCDWHITSRRHERAAARTLPLRARARERSAPALPRLAASKPTSNDALARVLTSDAVMSARVEAVHVRAVSRAELDAAYHSCEKI